MKARQRLYLQLQGVGMKVEQVTAMLAVTGKKVEVVASDAEGTGKSRRPKADEGAADIFEGKLALRFGGLYQPGSLPRRIDRARPHPAEPSIEPQCVENVAGTAEFVAARFKILETAHRSDRNVRVRLEPCHDSKWGASVERSLRNSPAALNLIGATVDDDHLAVQVGKCTEAEIPVFEDSPNTHLTIVYAGDEGA